MSELAGAYYTERAERFGIPSEVMPVILDGQPVRLLDVEDNRRLSVHYPDRDVEASINGRYEEVVRSVADFSMRCYMKSEGLVGVRETPNRKSINNRHFGHGLHNRLVPKKTQAGHIRDVTIEAVTLNRNDILGAWLSQPVTAHSPAAEASNVYLLTSGVLYSGRILGRVAYLSVIATLPVSVEDSSLPYVAPSFAGEKLPLNGKLMDSGEWQSAAIRNYIDYWGLAKPQLQNVRRGKTDRGRGGAQ